MLGAYFIHLIIGIYIICSNIAYASISVYEEDLELSKKVPLVSGIEPKKILEQNKVAITLCSNHLNTWVDHTSLIFEIKHPHKDEINLFAVHFGGDGHSEIIDKNLPTIDDSYETLKKVYRGKRINRQDIDYEKAVYKRHVVFVIDKNQAINAIKNVEDDKDLNYSTMGYGFYQNTYNCCTYVDKVLKDAGININFSYSPIKNAGSLISCCLSYQPNDLQERLIPNKYCDYSDIDGYKDSLKNLFNKGLEFKKDNNYDESMKHILESAKRGHPIAQCFIGFCYYNNDKVKDEFNVYFNYAQKYQDLHESLDGIPCFYNLLLYYDKFISSDYFKKSIKNHDEKKAFKWVERSAKKGFSISEGVLGYFYIFGKGTKLDENRGISYTKKAAKEDVVASMNIYKWYKDRRNKAYSEAIRKTKSREDFYLNINQNSTQKLSFNYHDFLSNSIEEEYARVERLFGFSDDKSQEYLNFSISQGLDEKLYSAL